MRQHNHHCSVVRVEETGVMIEGASGSGKTSLALGLVDTARTRGLDAALVCDDQALLSIENGKLVASVPRAIAGKAEIRGYGVADFPFEPSCAITLIGRLVPDADVERMPEADTETLMGIKLPLVRLPKRHEQQSVRILLAAIGEAAAGRSAAKSRRA